MKPIFKDYNKTNWPKQLLLLVLHVSIFVYYIFNYKEIIRSYTALEHALSLMALALLFFGHFFVFISKKSRREKAVIQFLAVSLACLTGLILFLYYSVNSGVSVQFFQSVKWFVILFVLSLFLTYFARLLEACLAIGPISVLVFRAYSERSSSLQSSRAGMYKLLLNWGRTEGLIPPGRSLRDEYYLPNFESLDSDDKDWRQVVTQILKKVRIVIVEITDLTPSLLWEINTSLQFLPTESIVLIDYRASWKERIHDRERDFKIVRPGNNSRKSGDLLLKIRDHVSTILGPAPSKRIFVNMAALMSAWIGKLLALVCLLGFIFKLISYVN